MSCNTFKMDRTIAPEYKEIEKIQFIEPNLKRLDNGLDLIIFKTGSQEIVKVELIFDAGVIRQSKNLIASTCNSMLREGSEKYTADEIAEQLDFYGSHLSLSVDKDFAKVTLFSLEKYLDLGLEILSDLILKPLFPQDKLDRQLAKSIQSFKLDQEKVKNLAARKFTQVMFGEQHPYGATANLEDYSMVSRDDLKGFYQKFYQPNNCKMMIAGQYSIDIVATIQKYFGSWENTEALEAAPIFETPKPESMDFLVAKQEAMQSGIRLGKILFNRLHPDYAKMQVVNTLLGGYFGSRLMKNIREDKGYTYGIGSALISQKETGYFTIVSEVNADVSQNTLDEINKELKILRTELVPEEELSIVKSYMLGRLLRSADGPFALSESYLNVGLFGLDWSYYQNYIQTIKAITAQDIMELSQQYLHEDSLIKIVAGRMA